MKYCMSAALLAAATASIGFVSLGALEVGPRAPQRLCLALESIQEGERLPVVFEGILTAHEGLYDPFEPRCPHSGESSTLVELPLGLDRIEELDRLWKKDKAVLVRLAGDFFGPEPGGPERKDLPLEVSAGIRLPRPHGSYLLRRKTKLIVREILEVRPASEVSRMTPSRTMSILYPAVKKAELPTEYPVHARRLELSGEVKVRITVQAGELTAVDLLAGDSTLVEDTISSIRTWRFKPGANAIFTTTFVYRIESGPPSATGLRVVAELPCRVEIIARR